MDPEIHARLTDPRSHRREKRGWSDGWVRLLADCLSIRLERAKDNRDISGTSISRRGGGDSADHDYSPSTRPIRRQLQSEKHWLPPAPPLPGPTLASRACSLPKQLLVLQSVAALAHRAPTTRAPTIQALDCPPAPLPGSSLASSLFSRSSQLSSGSSCAREERRATTLFNHWTTRSRDTIRRSRQIRL
jgi:hypothetical protein